MNENRISQDPRNITDYYCVVLGTTNWRPVTPRTRRDAQRTRILHAKYYEVVIHIIMIYIRGVFDSNKQLLYCTEEHHKKYDGDYIIIHNKTTK